MPVSRRKFNPSLFRYRKGEGGEIVNPKLRGKGRYEGRVSEGYEYTGDKPFRFKTPGGEVRTIQPGERLSNRQYQNLRYAASGWDSKSQFERVTRDSATKAGRRRLSYKRGSRTVHEVGAFRQWARIYAEERGIDPNSTEGKRIYSDPTSPYSQAFARALQDDFSDLTPDGPFAQLLVAIGLRDDQADWNVGDTQAT